MNKTSKELGYLKASIVEILLGLFWLLPMVHDWVFTLNLPLSVHFCNHFACILFSLIWFGFAYDKYNKKKHKKKENKKKKQSNEIIEIVVFIVGIILMNMVVCDASGNMSFNFSLSPTASIALMDAGDEVVDVPVPPCRETDDGRDPISFGEILSGANVEDICMGTDILRERFCYSTLAYTSEDIRCSSYGIGWGCEEGECRYNPITPTPTPTSSPSPSVTPTPTPSSTPANPEDSGFECGNGIDDDDDQLIDCADPDCSDICGSFEDSCAHISTLYNYPTCEGTCPAGSSCIVYLTEENGWCECMPDGETACGDAETCSEGWCADGEFCLGVPSCHCSAFPCDETDFGYNILLGGGCDDGTSGWLMDYCDKFGDLVEYECTINGCISHLVDCDAYGYACVWTEDGSYCGEIIS